MISYNEAASFFAKSRDKSKGAKIDHNTYVIRSGENYGIKLYNTVVIMISPDNHFTLDNGGFWSVTTKDRLNKFGPVRIIQRKGDWFFEGRDGLTPFVRGMTLTIKDRPQ